MTLTRAILQSAVDAEAAKWERLPEDKVLTLVRIKKRITSTIWA